MPAPAMTTRRGYPTEADAPFDEMARTITGMSWGAGWFAEIGYGENETALIQSVEYSKRIADGWDPLLTSIGGRVTAYPELVFAPMVDTSQVQSFESALRGMPRLVFVPQWDTSNVTNMNACFWGTANLIEAPKWDYSKVTILDNAFRNTNIRSVPNMNCSKCTNFFLYICKLPTLGKNRIH